MKQKKTDTRLRISSDPHQTNNKKTKGDCELQEKSMLCNSGVDHRRKLAHKTGGADQAGEHSDSGALHR